MADPDRSLKVINGFLLALREIPEFSTGGSLEVNGWGGGAPREIEDLAKQVRQDLIPFIHVSAAPDGIFTDSDTVGYDFWTIGVTITTMLEKTPAGLTPLEGGQLDLTSSELPPEVLIYRYYTTVTENLRLNEGSTVGRLGGISQSGEPNYIEGTLPGSEVVSGLGGSFVPLNNVTAITQDFQLQLSIER